MISIKSLFDKLLIFNIREFKIPNKYKTLEEFIISLKFNTRAH
jgi:hypothetical protein